MSLLGSSVNKGEKRVGAVTLRLHDRSARARTSYGLYEPSLTSTISSATLPCASRWTASPVSPSRFLWWSIDRGIAPPLLLTPSPAGSAANPTISRKGGESNSCYERQGEGIRTGGQFPRMSVAGNLLSEKPVNRKPGFRENPSRLLSE